MQNEQVIWSLIDWERSSLGVGVILFYWVLFGGYYYILVDLEDFNYRRKPNVYDGLTLLAGNNQIYVLFYIFT